MRILVLSDLHLADRPPASCTDTYTDDLFDLLGQVRQVAAQRGVDAVAVAGDIFHHKGPSRTSHRLVQRLIREFRAFGIRVLVVDGNHDRANDRAESLRETQPFGVLLESGAVEHLVEWEGLLPGSRNELPVFGVPWLQHWTDETVGTALAWFREWVTGHGARDNCLVVTHAPLYPPGRELKWEHYPAQKFADAMGNRGFCFYGHVHEPHGVWECGGVTFCNNGALSRGSLHEYNLSREVGVTLWDSGTGEFEFVPLLARPAAEVFRLQEKAQVTDMKGRLDEFLAGVAATKLESLSTGSVLTHIRGEGLPPAEISLIEELLAEASGK